MIPFFRRHLSAKLFLSYLLVVIVGVTVLASSAELVLPSAFGHHLSEMSSMMSGMMGNTSDEMKPTTGLLGRERYEVFGLPATREHARCRKADFQGFH